MLLIDIYNQKLTHLWQEEIDQNSINQSQNDQDNPEFIADILESCRRGLEKNDRCDELPHDAERHAKTADYHREDFRGDQIHGSVEAGGVEDDEEEDEEDTKAQAGAVVGVGLYEFGRHGGFAGQTENYAYDACQDETTTSKSVDEKPIE